MAERDESSITVPIQCFECDDIGQHATTCKYSKALPCNAILLDDMIQSVQMPDGGIFPNENLTDLSLFMNIALKFFRSPTKLVRTLTSTQPIWFITAAALRSIEDTESGFKELNTSINTLVSSISKMLPISQSHPHAHNTGPSTSTPRARKQLPMDTTPSYGTRPSVTIHEPRFHDNNPDRTFPDLSASQSFSAQKEALSTLVRSISKLDLTTQPINPDVIKNFCNQITRLEQRMEDKECKTIFLSKIDLTAEQALAHVINADDDSWTIQDALDEIRANFIPHHDQKGAATRLASISQGSDTLVAYHSKVRSLLAESKINPRTTDQLIIGMYIRGVSDENVRDKLSRQWDKQDVNLAEIMKYHEGIIKSKSRFPTLSHISYVSDTPVMAIPRSSASSHASQPPATSSPSFPPGSCGFHPRATNHLQKDCKRQSAQRCWLCGHQASGEDLITHMKTCTKSVCFYCKRSGHVVHNCEKRKQANLKRDRSPAANTDLPAKKPRTEAPAKVHAVTDADTNTDAE